MAWQAVLALVIAIPIILFPVLFIWFLNVGGIYAAIKEGKLKVLEPIGRAIGTTLAVIVPVGVYALLIWFFLGHFGWQGALAVALALPIVLFVPVLVWAAVVSGLYLVIRDTVRRRATAPRRRAARMAKELSVRKVT